MGVVPSAENWPMEGAAGKAFEDSEVHYFGEMMTESSILRLLAFMDSGNV